MYWRKSSIDAGNNKLPEPHVTFDLYQSTDDYAPYIKFDIDMFGGSVYPWCAMHRDKKEIVTIVFNKIGEIITWDYRDKK